MVTHKEIQCTEIYRNTEADTSKDVKRGDIKWSGVTYQGVENTYVPRYRSTLSVVLVRIGPSLLELWKVTLALGFLFLPLEGNSDYSLILLLICSDPFALMHMHIMGLFNTICIICREIVSLAEERIDCVSNSKVDSQLHEVHGCPQGS